METFFADSSSNDLISSTSSISISSFGAIETPVSNSLKLLSFNLTSIFQTHDACDSFFSDARIFSAAEGRQVNVHRCILSSRSSFFKRVFDKKREKSEFELSELLGNGERKVGFDSLLCVLRYLYSGQVEGLLKEVCACLNDGCCHWACRPAIDFVVELLFLSFTFEISELVGVYQRHLQDILDKVARDDILGILSVADTCGQACESLVAKCTEIVLRSDIDIVTIEKTLPQHLAKLITDSRKELGLMDPEEISFPDKHVRRIYKTLDLDDVELLQMLLKEGHTSLDNACALHYAVAYCNPKTTTEILDLGLADVNLRNSRGYTVLHVAAMRKEPYIIVSLLAKGAQPLDLTPYGHKAVHISKSLTKAADYHKPTEDGKYSHKDRLCIEVLKEAERRTAVPAEASTSPASGGNDVRMKLLYLENRVGLAKLLYPMEAQVAMDIAHVHGTSEFTVGDLSEAGSTFQIREEHMKRLKALSKTGKKYEDYPCSFINYRDLNKRIIQMMMLFGWSWTPKRKMLLSFRYSVVNQVALLDYPPVSLAVELGKRYFPRCAEVLNNIMDADDLSEIALLGNGTPEERSLKKRRYSELLGLLSKAFNEDKEELDKQSTISSSSSTSVGIMRSKVKFKSKR